MKVISRVTWSAAAILCLGPTGCHSTRVTTGGGTGDDSPTSDETVLSNQNQEDAPADVQNAIGDSQQFDSGSPDELIVADADGHSDVSAPDVGSAVRQEIHIDDADSVIFYQTGLAGSGAVAAKRIVTGSIVKRDPVEQWSTGMDYSISGQCPEAYTASTFEPVIIVPDGGLDATYLSPGETICGYVPDLDDGSIRAYRDAGIADLLSADGSPHPTCTMKVEYPKFPAWSGFEGDGRLLIIISSRNVDHTENAADHGSVVNVVSWVAPINEAGMVVTAEGAWMPEEFVAIRQVPQWRNARALCDYHLAGAPAGKTWEDFLPQ